MFNAAKFGRRPPTARVPCSNAAKTRNPLKLGGVPQTPEQMSAVSWQKFAILCGRLEEILLLNRLFSDCRYIALVLKLCDGAEMAIFGNFWRAVFSASRMPQVSDLHPKFSLKPHHVWSMVDIKSATAEIRRGKKIEDER